MAQKMLANSEVIYYRFSNASFLGLTIMWRRVLTLALCGLLAVSAARVMAEGAVPIAADPTGKDAGNPAGQASDKELKADLGMRQNPPARISTHPYLDKLPLVFVKNDGQVDKRVKYYASTRDLTVYFTNNGIYFSFARYEQPAVPEESRNPRPLLPANLFSQDQKGHREVIRLLALGASKKVIVAAEGLQAGYFNYFIGNNPRKWRTKVPLYSTIIYKEIYPGIDLRFYANGRQVEYDVIAKWGAGPSRVKLAFEGIQGLRRDEAGNLLVQMQRGAIVQKAPHVYQKIEGKEVAVAGRFQILRPARGSRKFAYGFSIGSYDKRRPIIIDPQIDYSTYLGGDQSEDALGIVADTDGYAYVCGATNSVNFPATVGAFDTSFSGGDGFVTKFSQDGAQLIYSTFLGGTNGDYCVSLAVDSSGAAYLAGVTLSTDFPTASPFQANLAGGRDATVSKLSADGSALLYSTYLGGSSDDGPDGIAVDSDGNAYVGGGTTSGDFPVLNAVQPVLGGGPGDGFVTELNPQGSSLVFSTFLGGTAEDTVGGVIVDGSGAAYVAGWTNSVNFPVTPGAFQTADAGGDDCFVSKIAPGGGSFVYSTYLGGSGSDAASAIAVDGPRAAYITGITFSADFPLVNPIQNTLGCCGDADAFVSKLSPDGSSLVYSTFLGGSNIDGGSAIAVDASGAVYVTGTEYSFDFPLINPLAYECKPIDAFVTKVNPQGSDWVYSTCLGGRQEDEASAIALDSAGGTYVVGFTESSDFPVRNALQPGYGGNIDGFVTKLVCDSVDDVRVFENSQGAVFPVRLCSPRAADASLDYATSDGTATAGVDYVATAGTLNILAGSTSAAITVPLISNNLPGGERTFYLNLANPMNLDVRRYSIGTILGGLLLDDFSDNVVDWTTRGTWTEGGGSLRVTATRSATAFASLPWSPSGVSGCSTCTIETDMQTAGGPYNKVFLEGWYLNDSNKVELILLEEKGKWVLKQRSGGVVVARAHAKTSTAPDISYHVKLAFDGTDFTLSIDGLPMLTMRAAAPASGNVGFKVKKTTGTFGPIRVY